MRKWHLKQSARSVLILVFFVGLVLVAGKILWPGELVYKGKPVSEWMEIAFWGDLPGTSVSSEEWMEAVDALDKIGTNAIPCALKLAWTRDSKLKLAFLTSPWPRRVFNVLGLPKLYDRWVTARWVQASSVSPQVATKAFKLLGRRGKPAIPALLRLLSTSDNPNGRVAAARMLQCIGPDAQRTLPELLQGFRDPNPAVRGAVQEAVASISSIEAPGVPDDLAWAEYHRYAKQSADLIVPVILKLLTDPKADAERLIESLQIFSFGEGRAATPGLQRLLSHPNEQIRTRATNALKRLDPSALESGGP